MLNDKTSPGIDDLHARYDAYYTSQTSPIYGSMMRLFINTLKVSVNYFLEQYYIFVIEIVHYTELVNQEMS